MINNFIDYWVAHLACFTVYHCTVQWVSFEESVHIFTEWFDELKWRSIVIIKRVCSHWEEHGEILIDDKNDSEGDGDDGEGDGDDCDSGDDGNVDGGGGGDDDDDERDAIISLKWFLTKLM